MDTSCLRCVFAEWGGRTQVGCDFDRLDKFDEQGVVIEGHEDEVTGKQYFLIKDRICNTCRDEDAVKGILPRKRKETVRRQVVPPVCMAVYLDADSDLADRSIRSIIDQTTPAKEIVLIYNVNGTDAPIEYGLRLSEEAERAGLSWRVQSIREPGADYGRAVDLTIRDKTLKGFFFSCGRAGYLYPPDFVEIIDRAINDELMRFIALLPDNDDNGIVVQMGLHRLLGGNQPAHGAANIVDKLKDVAESEGTSHMIKRWEDVRECVLQS